MKRLYIEDLEDIINKKRKGYSKQIISAMRNAIQDADDNGSKHNWMRKNKEVH